MSVVIKKKAEDEGMRHSKENDGRKEWGREREREREKRQSCPDNWMVEIRSTVI
jgi:hypothetical protein